MKPVKAVIFDLDGTLVRVPSTNFFDDLLVRALNRVGVSTPPARERTKLWVSGQRHEELLRSWGVGDAHVFWKVFDELDYETRKGMIERGVIHPYEDVSYLEELSLNVPLGIVTNTSPRVTFLEVKSFNLQRFFSVVVALGTERQSEAKPETTGVLEAFEALGCYPSEGVMVGDSDADVIAGKKAGSKVIVVVCPHVRLKTKPDIYVENLYELKRLVYPTSGFQTKYG
ncbi:MAG: HAD-IA family hydrolase [Candidatus Freyarchaeota archaeon]|nr:HAD-IA family hydrolase [Candidatus Jordarchaeia archaeon]